MQRNIIKHFLSQHKDKILEKSLRNCHVKGMDSVMLDDTPGARIRIFFANEEHDLHKNYNIPKTLAAHAHHCDLTLSCIYGSFENIIFKEASNSPHVCLNEWEYTSEILQAGKGGFKTTERTASFEFPKRNTVYNGEETHMIAADIHTVFVRKGMSAVWVVYEGKEDRNYKSLSYTNTDLSNFNTDNLYQKMDGDYLLGLFRKYKLA